MWIARLSYEPMVHRTHGPTVQQAVTVRGAGLNKVPNSEERERERGQGSRPAGRAAVAGHTSSNTRPV